MIAGMPSVVLAIFGLLVFSQSFLGFLSQNAADGAVTGQSFLAAGAMMALLALPLIVGATREALAQIPDRMREASLRARQDPRHDDPPRAAALDPPEHRRAASCSAWAGSSATPRSSSSCSAGR